MSRTAHEDDRTQHCTWLAIWLTRTSFFGKAATMLSQTKNLVQAFRENLVVGISRSFGSERIAGCPCG